MVAFTILCYTECVDTYSNSDNANHYANLHGVTEKFRSDGGLVPTHVYHPKMATKTETSLLVEPNVVHTSIPERNLEDHWRYIIHSTLIITYLSSLLNYHLD